MGKGKEILASIPLSSLSASLQRETDQDIPRRERAVGAGEREGRQAKAEQRF